MTEISMFLFLVVTTVYGWLMYRRGERAGIKDLVEIMADAGIIKSPQSLETALDEYAAKL